MGLGLILIALLMLGLGLFQGWLLWYVRRESTRLDHRIDESLDDEDLIQFQEQLRGLLAQVKDAGSELIVRLEKSQASVEKTTDRARETEQKLAVRLQAMEKLVAGLVTRLATAEANAGAVVVKSAPQSKKAVPKPPKAAPVAKAPRPLPLPPPAASILAPKPAEAEPDRSYLVRPSAVPAAANRHQRIYDLADQGLSREAIARETRVLPGEVDLILNLRRQRDSKG